MSSPHLESLFTIPEATDDLWPFIQENNSSLVLEPSMFQCQEGGNVGKESLAENRNVHRKDDKDDGNYSTSIQVVDHQWSFPPSPPIMDNGNGDKLDSISVLAQEISAGLPDYNIDKLLLQKELQDCRPNSKSTGLLPPFNASDYAGSLLQGSSTLLSIEDNARTDELDSSTFILEPVDPNIEEGLLESMLINYPIDDDSFSAPPEHSDEINLLLQESSSQKLPSTDEKTRDINDQTDFSLVPEKEISALAEPSSGKGLIAKRVSSKTRGRNYRFKQGSQIENKKVQSDKGEGTTMKKQEHNAKERIRRMKLHASYLALGALLPDSSRSKTRKSAPLIIDRAVDYIPELEEEIEKLTLKKNEMLSTIKNKQPVVNLKLREPLVSVHEIKQGDFIVQIYCTQGDGAFSNLLQKVEEEEDRMCIMSASTLQVSDHGLCCHLHIQMNECLDGENHLSSLREKVISWLC